VCVLTWQGSGLFHGDPHPGNLLACRDGTLAYLDFGMMSESPEEARYAIMAHVVHLVNRWGHPGASGWPLLDVPAVVV
jgi:predicted unusual protein kinase regulating ubiquinone biosynthesis (AarF/ABC1/UbiB family)